jgi:hypothetical protein
MDLHRAPPELWPQLGREEVRGPSSEAVSAGVADTPAVSAGLADSTAVEALTASPVPGVQKPPRWGGKWFWDRFEAAAPLRAWRPKAVQKTPAWPRRSRLGVCPRRSRLGVCPAVSCGCVGCQARHPR